MPVRRCVWGLCNTDSRYPQRCEGVRFVPFAKPRKALDKCLRWIKACGRPDSQLNVSRITKWVYICSKHFVDGWPSEENPDPVSAIPDSSAKSLLYRCRSNRPGPRRGRIGKESTTIHPVLAGVSGMEEAEEEMMPDVSDVKIEIDVAEDSLEPWLAAQPDPQASGYLEEDGPSMSMEQGCETADVPSRLPGVVVKEEVTEEQQEPAPFFSRDSKQKLALTTSLTREASKETRIKGPKHRSWMSDSRQSTTHSETNLSKLVLSEPASSSFCEQAAAGPDTCNRHLAAAVAANNKDVSKHLLHDLVRFKSKGTDTSTFQGYRHTSHSNSHRAKPSRPHVCCQRSFCEQASTEVSAASASKAASSTSWAKRSGEDGECMFTLWKPI